MNNDQYRNPYKTLRQEDIEEEMKNDQTRLALSLEKIVRNRDWKIVVEQYLIPRMNGARENADKMDGAELFRFQGEIRILKRLVNLQNELDAQKNTLEHAQTEEE